MSDFRSEKRISKLKAFYSQFNPVTNDFYYGGDFDSEKEVHSILNKPTIEETIQKSNELLHLNKKYSVQNKDFFYHNYEKYLSMNEELKKMETRFSELKKNFTAISTHLSNLHQKSVVVKDHLTKKDKKIQIKKLKTKLLKKKFLMTLIERIEKRIIFLEETNNKEDKEENGEIVPEINKIIKCIKIGIKTKIIKEYKLVEQYQSQIKKILISRMLSNCIDLSEFIVLFNNNGEITSLFAEKFPEKVEVGSNENKPSLTEELEELMQSVLLN